MTSSPELTGRAAVSARLCVGSHLGPEDGVCLMEAVSGFVGLPWSDEPVCTHPLVAHLARLVNDASSDDGRQRLARFVPRLATAGGDETTYAHVAGACAEVASRWRRSLLLAHLSRLADAELRREATGREVGLDVVRCCWRAGCTAEVRPSGRSRRRSTPPACSGASSGTVHWRTCWRPSSSRRDGVAGPESQSADRVGLDLEERVPQLHRSSDDHTEERARERPMVGMTAIQSIMSRVSLGLSSIAGLPG